MTLTPSFCCQQVDKYFEDMRHGSHCHSHIKLSTCDEDNCLLILVAKLREANCLQKVTSLSTRLVMGHGWSHDIGVWALFINLETLELRPCLALEFVKPQFNRRARAAYCLGMEDPSPGELSLSSVQTLVWHGINHISLRFGRVQKIAAEFFGTIGPSLLKMFGNVKTLKFVDMDFYLFHRYELLCSTHLHKVECLSIRTLRRYSVPSNLAFPFHLTRIEFNMDTSHWDNILLKVAPTLEHLAIRALKTIEYQPFILAVPILPRLKEFRLLWSPTEFKSLGQIFCNHSKMVGPEVQLKFATASQSRGLDYATQFPVLTRLQIGREEKALAGEKGFNVGNGIYWFEICVPFLTRNFLSPRQGPCWTLRVFDIPKFPKTFETVRRLPGCGKCEVVQLRRSTLPSPEELEAQFYLKVGETFPNLENMATFTKPKLETNQERVEYEEKVRKWLLIGEELRLVTNMEGLSCKMKFDLLHYLDNLNKELTNVLNV